MVPLQCNSLPGLWYKNPVSWCCWAVMDLGNAGRLRGAAAGASPWQCRAQAPAALGVHSGPRAACVTSRPVWQLQMCAAKTQTPERCLIQAAEWEVWADLVYSNYIAALPKHNGTITALPWSTVKSVYNKLLHFTTPTHACNCNRSLTPAVYIYIRLQLTLQLTILLSQYLERNINQAFVEKPHL